VTTIAIGDKIKTTPFSWVQHRMNCQMAGRFITLEGGEGVGKTTNMACIQALLEEQNIPLLLTREPGGTALAENYSCRRPDRHKSHR
jgi:ABC-type proline/glycine betaine transport system ATPase subunit